MHKTSGFTLIQTLVTLAIGAVIAAVGAGTYVHVRNQAQDRKVEADAATLNKAIDTLLVTGGSLPSNATPQDVILALKATPDSTLAKETIAVRQVAAPSTGISAYNDSDGRERLVLIGGRFSTATDGPGWILDNSNNVQVTTESRKVLGAKFASTSKWIWDYATSSAGTSLAPVGPVSVSIVSSATLLSVGHYQITSAGSYTVTATTAATSGVLSLNAGPFNDTTEIGSGNQRLSHAIRVGPGAKFTIYATATLSAPGANDSKELTIDVNIPGTPPSTPISLAITGPDAVSVRKSEGTKTVSYQYLLTYQDGTVATGPLANPAQGIFNYRSDVPGESRLISDTESGLTATKNVAITYWPTVQVTVTALPANAGSASITAPNNSGQYDQGAAITVLATPTAGMAFASWSGSASGSGNPLNITANSNMTIVANFAPALYKLIAVGAAGGTVSTSTANVGLSSDGYPLFTAGTVVTLVATADPGKSFTAWAGTNGTDVSGGTPGSLTVNSDKSVIATFGTGPAPTHSLTVLLSNAAAGTGNGSTSGLKVNDATPVSVTLASGWTITGASVTGGATLSGAPTDNSRTVTMGSQDAVVTYQVTASGTSRTLTLTPSTAAGGTVGGGGTYPDGATATITATPSVGWKFAGWAGADGGSVSGGTSGSSSTQTGTILMTADRSVVANFSQIFATSTWSAQASGGSGNYTITSIQIFTAADRTNPVYSQQNPGGSIASVTVTLPVGSYVVVATATDAADATNTATVESPLVVAAP